MEWFETLTGFREAGYDDTRVKLKVEGGQLKSLANGRSYRIGELELVSLQALRERVASADALPGRLKVSLVTGEVRHMRQFPENAGALFQVASQFNLLEMIGPEVTPEQGVTRYQHDRTKAQRVRSLPVRPRSTVTTLQWWTAATARQQYGSSMDWPISASFFLRP